MVKYLFIKTEHGQKIWRKTVQSINMGGIMKTGDFISRAGDLISRAGEREIGPKSGSLLPEMGDLTGLLCKQFH